MINTEYPYPIDENPKLASYNLKSLYGLALNTLDKSTKNEIGLEMVRRIAEVAFLCYKEDKIDQWHSLLDLKDITKKGKYYGLNKTSVQFGKEVRLAAGLKVIEIYEANNAWDRIIKASLHPNLPMWLTPIIRFLQFGFKFAGDDRIRTDLNFPIQIKKIAKTRIGSTVYKILHEAVTNNNAKEIINLVSYGTFWSEMVITPMYDPLPYELRVKIGTKFVEICYKLENTSVLDKFSTDKNSPKEVQKLAARAREQIVKAPGTPLIIEMKKESLITQIFKKKRNTKAPTNIPINNKIMRCR